MTQDIHSTDRQNDKTARLWIRRWLILIGLMVYAMILVGGATRLTDSGLSITEWKPISGALPPLSSAEWAMLFDQYKQTAEYQLQNKGMSLSEFEYIYWWEWGHRLLGRVIGLVAVVGFVAFLRLGWLTEGRGWKLGLLIVLGGLQGAIGWWMVSSGIGTTRIDVAPYRLMTHFCLALLIIALTAWFWLDLGQRAKQVAVNVWTLILGGFSLLIFLQMASGALVAGLDAGRTYTDWPLMAGEFFPSSYWIAQMGIRNIFENIATVQFNHRMMAYAISVATILIAVFGFRHRRLFGLGPVIALIICQIIWGILTLMNAAPLELALIHQGIGVLIMIASVRSLHRAAHVIQPLS